MSATIDRVSPEPCNDIKCLHLYCGTARLLPAKARLVWWKECREIGQWYAKKYADSNTKA